MDRLQALLSVQKATRNGAPLNKIFKQFKTAKKKKSLSSSWLDSFDTLMTVTHKQLWEN